MLIGFAAGWAANTIVRGMRLRGCLQYVVMATIGALMGGYLFRALGFAEVVRVVAAAIGAIVVLLLLRVLRRA